MLELTKTINSFCLCLLVVIAVSCNNQKSENSFSLSKSIASVNGTQLQLSDIENILPKEISKEDSVGFVKNYLTNWASNEVFYQQAIAYLTSEELDVEKELDAYKKELVVYKFQTKLINDKLDTVVTPMQIEDFYNENTSIFLLKSNIVKALYIKTPKNIPNLEKLKSLCYSTNNPKDAEQLKNLCIQYANNFYMNENTWLLYDDLKKEMNQLNEVPDYNLQKGKTFEFTDATSFYFLKIIDVKSKNTLSPLNFEKQNIKNMLINQRKQRLITTIKKDFYEKALLNKEIELQ